MKKAFAILLIAILIICMCFALTACNDDEGGKGLLFPGMSVEQIKEALKDITSYTKEYYYKDDELDGFYVYTDKGTSFCKTNDNGDVDTDSASAWFYEDNRFYNLSSENCEVVDFSGFDVDFDEYNLAKGFELEIGFLTEGNYRIENDTIVISAVLTKTGNPAKIVYKDFNASSVTIPYAYKDNYKTMQPTQNLLEFEDVSDTECRLSGCNIALKSLVVPNKHNGKDVAEIALSDPITAMTIPTTVRTIANCEYDESSTYAINYLGTRAQWAAVKKNSSFIKLQESGAITVNCSDGIVDASITLTENMTVDQLKDSLKDVNSFKVMTADSAEDMKNGIHSESGTYCKNGYSFVNYDTDIAETRIYETNRQYRIVKRYDEWSIKVFDYENYDVKDKNRATINLAQEYLNNTWMPIIEQGFSIENNMVYFNDGKSCLSTFNCATLNIPEKYKGYANMDANSKVVEFEEYSANGIDGYALKNTNLELNSLIIPETYNGKPVIRAVIDIQFMEIVTIPVCVKELSMIRPVQGNVVEITYLGSRVLWNEIDKSQNWWNNDYCTISCADDI